MVEFLAQSDYLREVQRTFGGSGHFNVMELLTQALSVGIPLVAVYVLWRYRLLLLYGVGRTLSRMLSSARHQAVENHLVSRGGLVEVWLLEDGEARRKICDARVSAVVGGRMVLRLINAQPTIARLRHARVVCYTKPFAYSGKRINAFVTLVAHAVKKGIVLKELSLLTPIRYRFVIRRRHTRQRVAHEGAVRVKAWSGRKANTFWMFRPDLQTVNNPARYDDRPRLSVENISAGGMRMHVINPKGDMIPLGKGDQLVLRVSIWNPKTRKYSFFTTLGTVRSRFSVRGGAIGLGIQFTLEGEKAGMRYAWRTVRGEIKSLAEFLAGIEG